MPSLVQDKRLFKNIICCFIPNSGPKMSDLISNFFLIPSIVYFGGG